MSTEHQHSQPLAYDPEVAPHEFANKIILKPSEVEHIWNSSEPKSLMSDYVMRLVKEKGSEWNKYSQYEQRWEKAECDLIGEYCLQALVFSRGEAQIHDSYTVGAITNTFFDILIPFDKGDLRLEERRQNLQESLKILFGQKRLKKEQVKAVLDFAQRTVFKHLALINLCFSKKRPFVERPVRITQSDPKIVGNLEANCKEHVDDDALRSQQDFYQPEDNIAVVQEESNRSHLQQQAEDNQPDADVDPEDPLYGLEQRMRNMNLDEESRRIIKEKLEEANQKIKFALDDRQKNLDVKMAGGAAGAPGAKKK